MINALCMLMEDLVAVYVGCGGKFTDTSKFKHHNICDPICQNPT